jgi:predicted nucleic acid-binding protein
MRVAEPDTAGEAGFVDTSVIVRFLVQDDPELTEQARRIIEEHPSLLTTTVTIAESAFVLMRVYGLSRHVVVDSLVGLLSRSNLAVHHLETSIVIEALMLCRPSGRVSFADAMLWASARSADAPSAVYTLDRRFPSSDIVVRTEL